MRCRPVHIPVCLLAAAAAAISCGPARKLAGLSDEGVSAQLSLPADKPLPQFDTLRGAPTADTLRVVGLDGREVLIMRAIRDDETGDMVATEELQAAVVSARFRNVAERNGKIDLEFQVTVPAAMQDSRWQLRLHPDLFAVGDSLRLDDVVVTGDGFRRMQMRGYEQYERYEKTIITDSSKFVDRRSLDIFLERNAGAGYASGELAEDHYTNHLAKNINEARRGRLGEKWRKYVKVPLLTEGIRLDSVVVRPSGEFEYTYVQTVNTRPGLRKIDIRMSGEIFEGEKRIYNMPGSDPLTFYVSSVSSFVDMADHYKTVILSRAVSANMTAVMDFERGSSELDETLSDNAAEMARVRGTLKDLLCSDAFVMDSIVVSAFASPEGSVERNDALTFRRAKSASDYFRSYVIRLQDSLRREEGFHISVGEDLAERVTDRRSGPDRNVSFLSRSGGENWMLLDELVEADSLMSPAAKQRYFDIAAGFSGDGREKMLEKESFYPQLRDRHYPALRRVRFDFHLHRSGMVKDTVHTNVLDTTYMDGVRALADHDYETALDRLAAYQDYNTAVAMVALDRNLSALSILEGCSRNARVNYMLALVHSRLGDERAAVECYIRSCEQEPSFVHRGNLDPEIAALIKKYNLNNDEI